LILLQAKIKIAMVSKTNPVAKKIAACSQFKNFPIDPIIINKIPKLNKEITLLLIIKTIFYKLELSRKLYN